MLYCFLFCLLTAVSFSEEKSRIIDPLKETTEGKFVDQKDPKKVLFLFKATPHIVGNDVRSERIYVCPEVRANQCPDGKIAAKEEIFYRKGKAFMMNTEHYQAKWSGSAVITGKKIKFSYIEKDEKKEEEETLKEQVLFTEEITPYIQKNWDSIVGGKTHDFRLPVIFRLETVGFKVFKDREENNTYVFSMKPSSIFIQAIVKPIYFYLDKDTKALVKVDGRTTPKLLEDGKVKDLDAVLLL